MSRFQAKLHGYTVDWYDTLAEAEAALDAAIDAEVSAKIEADERAFEEQYGAEHPDDDYLGRP